LGYGKVTKKRKSKDQANKFHSRVWVHKWVFGKQ